MTTELASGIRLKVGLAAIIMFAVTASAGTVTTTVSMAWIVEGGCDANPCVGVAHQPECGT